MLFFADFKQTLWQILMEWKLPHSYTAKLQLKEFSAWVSEYSGKILFPRQHKTAIHHYTKLHKLSFYEMKWVRKGEQILAIYEISVFLNILFFFSIIILHSNSVNWIQKFIRFYLIWDELNLSVTTFPTILLKYPSSILLSRFQKRNLP